MLRVFHNGLYVLIGLMVGLNVLTLFLFVSNFSRGEEDFTFNYGLTPAWGYYGGGIVPPAVTFSADVPSIRFRFSTYQDSSGLPELLVPSGQRQPSHAMISTAQKVRDQFATAYPKGWSTSRLSSGKTLSGLSRLKRIFSGAIKSNSQEDKRSPVSVWSGIRDWPTSNPLILLNLPPAIRLARTAEILHTKASPRGTQLKLEVTLDGLQGAFWKPQFYLQDSVGLHIVNSSTVYGGKDRHFGEIAAFYLNLLLGYFNSPLVVGRTLDLRKEVVEKGTSDLRNTFLPPLSNGSLCFYGVCSYCRPTDPVCSTASGTLEGALVILLTQRKFKTVHNPWRRTYGGYVAPWEAAEEPLKFCDNVLYELSRPPFSQKPSRMILDIVAVSIFDFLIGNGDRHHFEIALKSEDALASSHSRSILLIDNGKSFGNPHEDYFDILAPLFQCCRIRKPLYETLKKLSGSLGKSLHEISRLDSLHPLLPQSHLAALDRRLHVVLSTVQLCLHDTRNSKKKVIFE